MDEIPNDPSQPKGIHGAHDEINYDGYKGIMDILNDRAHQDKLLDFRPYMNETPVICSTCDSFKVVLETFRKMNLRHMPVLDSRDGKLKGMITRQDLFRWLDI